MKIGVQMYSLRDMCNSLEGTEKAFFEIAKMGAEVAEICYGDNISARKYSEIAKKNNIEICSTHSSLDRILNDTERLINEHLEFGCKIIGIGGTWKRTYYSLKKFCDNYSKAAETALKYGVSLAYHNHSHEFKKLMFKGRILDVILENTPSNVKLCLDIAWAKKGGASAEEYLNKCGDRVAIIHLKDYSLSERKAVILGTGDVGVRDVMKLAESKGVQYAVIEEESADNPLKLLQDGMKYINQK